MLLTIAKDKKIATVLTYLFLFVHTMWNRAASICVRNVVSRNQAVKAINSLWGSKALSRRSTNLKINKAFSSQTKFFFSTHSKVFQQQQTQITDAQDESGPDPEAVIQDVTRNNQKVARIGRSKYFNIFISFNNEQYMYY